MEALLRARLSAAGWRILLWVVRNTYGWNREWTPFTWYRIARQLDLDRAAAYRAGQRLIQAQILILREQRLAVQVDNRMWDKRLFGSADDAGQLWMPGITDAGEQRRALPGDNADVAARQQKRCQETTPFRRAKDRCKERLKINKDRHSPQNNDARSRFGTSAHTERRHLAGAAKPIPGKYDGLSQN